MATVEFWILAFAVTCAIYPDYAQGQFLKRLRRCTLPHERRPWFWERTEQYCSASRVLEHRSRTQSCVCEPGYYRDEETNNCYDARLCGHCDSSKHERFNRCTNDCEAVCGKQVIQQCDKPCVPGCECMKGYIRKHKNGPCVPIQTCPPKCPAYMTFEMHRERCPRICNVAREDSCSETNEGPGCACRKGFVLRAPFGTVRTRVWCIHESMCTFPDEVKGADGRQYVKGGRMHKGSTAARNDTFSASKQDQRGVQEPMPKGTDEDLFLGGKGFPPIGNLANMGGQRKLGAENGEIAQGKVAPGNEEQWRWNHRQPEIQGSWPQKIDQDLLQDKKRFSSLGGLTQKTGEGFRVSQEKRRLKGSEEVRGAGLTGNANFWGWDEVHRGSESSVSKKRDKDLYRGVNHFSRLGYSSPTAGQGSQLRQQAVGFIGSYSGHGRGVSRRDRFWDRNKHQARLGNSAFQQTSSNLYQGTGGFTAQGHLGYGSGQATAIGPQETGFEGAQMGQGQFQVRGRPVESTGQASLINLEETGFEGGQRMQVQAASTSNNLWASQKGKPGFQENVPKGYDDTQSLGTKGYSPLGDVGNTRGQGSLLLRGSFVGRKHGGSSDQWKETHGEQRYLGLGLGGEKSKQGQNFDIDDWLSGQQSSTMPDFTKGQEGDEGLVPTKIIDNWTPDKGQLQKGASKKGGLPSSIMGAGNVPGVGLPVGKLPDLPKLDESGSAGGFPGVGIPGGNISNILDILEAKVNAQNAINEPGQIQIIGRGGSATKGGQQHISTDKKTRAALPSGIKGGLTSSIKGASNLPGVGVPVGKLPELPKLGGNGAASGIPGVGTPGENISNMLDMLEATVNAQKAISGPGQIEIIGHGGSATKGGQQHISTERKTRAALPSGIKGDLTSSIKGASNLPGVGLPVGKLPELPKLGGNGAASGIPGVGTPGKNISNMLDMLEATVNAQKAISGPGQIEIIGHGGSSTKGGQQHISTEKKTRAALPSGIKGGLTSSVKGANNVPGVGLSVEKQPELPKLGGIGGPGSIPGVGLPVEKQQSNLDILEAKVNAQRAINGGGEIEIIGHGGSGTKGGQQHINIETKVSAANPSGKKGDLTSSNKGTNNVPGDRLPVGKPPELPNVSGNGSSGGIPGMALPSVKPANILKTPEGKVGSPKLINEPGQIQILGHGGTGTKGGHLPGAIKQKAGAVDLTRQTKALPTHQTVQPAKSALPVASPKISSLSEQKQRTHFGGQGTQTRQGSTAQSTTLSWTQQNELLSTPSEFQRPNVAFPVPSATPAPNYQQSESTDFTGQDRLSQQGNTVQPVSVEWKQQKQPLSGFLQLQMENGQFPLSGVDVALNKQQRDSTRFNGQGWRQRQTNAAEPGSTVWVQENQPSSGVSQYPRAAAPGPISGTAFVVTNEQPDSTGLAGHGWQFLQGNTAQPSVVEWTQQNKALSGISKFRRATTSVPLSRVASANKQPVSAHFAGHGRQAPFRAKAQPSAVKWMQKNEPFSGTSQFQKATASVHIPGTTAVSSVRQQEGRDFTRNSWQTSHGNMEQPSAAFWTEQSKPLSGILEFQRATALYPLPYAAIASNNQQTENTHLTTEGWRTLQSNTQQPGLVDWTRQNEPLADIPQYQRAMGSASFSGATAASTNEQLENTDFRDQGWQARHGVPVQTVGVDWTHQNEPLLGLLRFQKTKGSVVPSEWTSGSHIVQKEATDFSGRNVRMHPSNTVPSSTTDRAQENNPVFVYRTVQRPTATVSLSGATVASSNSQKKNKVFADKLRQTGYSGVAQPGAIKFTQKNTGVDSLSDAAIPPNRQRKSRDLTGIYPQASAGSKAQPAAVGWMKRNQPFKRLLETPSAVSSLPPSGASALSINQGQGSAYFTSNFLPIGHDSVAQPGIIDWAEQQPPLSMLPEFQSSTASSHLSGASVASIGQEKGSADLETGKASQPNDENMKPQGAIYRTQQNHPRSQLPVFQRVTASSAALLSAAAASGNEVKRTIDLKGTGSQMHHDSVTKTGVLDGLRGEGSQTGHGSTAQPVAQNINVGGETEGALDKQKETSGQRIVHSGIHVGKKVFDGLYNMWPYGGFFQYSMPTIGTGQQEVGNYPDVYGGYGAPGQPSFGEDMMPFGYPTVYPTPFVPMTNTWGQPKAVTDELQAQQQRVPESDIPASPSSLSNQNAQKTEPEVSTPGVKGIGVSGVPHKRTAGVAPAAKNYAFDDSSLDSW
ncbi:uncharacterized protein LOC119401630 isoform X1 [Rhipicephalus sanguineus]|uniref:uncharacterized protein LOC119401630 isoform X1 n=1 Tax=Rhipicephalus sanguineus TaxID=34632 RepID=UPI00189544EA|nr:uncharacterized protein LOC119401630 isoform X1 [Rhipicephalus sanguineus]